ncbi:transcription repressor OFP8-like [Lolium rigidum]|uniref:transcription repressor OFP8-like n=1 Tax=Lolium rigidum TaxID=89674 RepID=UPI001F5CEAE9|nr:transcription repressor OFP8-like [Lolium rigidum]
MHTPFMDKTPHHRPGVGAAGRLKQRLALLLVRSSCTTNTTKTTTTSVTTFVSLDKATANPRQEPRHSPDWCTNQGTKLEEGSRSHRHRRRSASVAHASTDCTGTASGRRSARSVVPGLSSPLPTNDAKKQSKSRGKPRSPSVPRRHCSYYSSGRGRRPPMASTPYSFSSSTVTDDESGEEAETRTLFSSLSFSSDSTSEFYHTNRSSASRKSHRNAPRRARRHSSVAAKHHQWNNKEEAGAVGEGMAVVKRSSNPYADFRSSMVEMVVERRLASAEKMEELLVSYLSLNSPEHHPAILTAFEDVWEAVFGQA